MGRPSKRGTPLSGDTEIGLGKGSDSTGSLIEQDEDDQLLLPVETEEEGSGTEPGLGSSEVPATSPDEDQAELFGPANTLPFDPDPLPKVVPPEPGHEPLMPEQGTPVPEQRTPVPEQRTPVPEQRTPVPREEPAPAPVETRSMIPPMGTKVPSGELVQKDEEEPPKDESDPSLDIVSNIGKKLVLLDDGRQDLSGPGGWGDALDELGPTPIAELEEGQGESREIEEAIEEGGLELSDEDNRFSPPKEESLPGFDLPDRGRPIGNMVPVHSSKGSSGGPILLDWQGYPSRIINRFRETEGEAVIYVLIVLLALGGAAVATFLGDAVAGSVGTAGEAGRVSIIVETTPPGAQVFLDGVMAPSDERTNAQLKLVPSAQVHRLRVGAPGFQGKKISFTAREDQTMKVELKEQ